MQMQVQHFMSSRVVTQLDGLENLSSKSVVSHFQGCLLEYIAAIRLNRTLD